MILKDEDPCKDCDRKVDDTWGRFCDMACGKHSGYLIKQEAYKAQLKKVVEELEKEIGIHSRTADDGRVWLPIDGFRQALLEEVK